MIISDTKICQNPCYLSSWRCILLVNIFQIPKGGLQKRIHHQEKQQNYIYIHRHFYFNIITLNGNKDFLDMVAGIKIHLPASPSPLVVPSKAPQKIWKSLTVQHGEEPHTKCQCQHLQIQYSCHYSATEKCYTTRAKPVAV